MERSGTSSDTSIDNYDVFLSFRGPDTRQGFVDCLYHFMMGAGIKVFKDDEDLRQGHRIAEVLEAIKNSKICMPIFSKDYPSSKWCMRELAKMVELDKETVPIFFDVTPDDVKLQTELYKDKLRGFPESLASETGQWKKALVEVASITGWELKIKGYGEFSKSVAAELSTRLKVKEKIITDYLIGMDDRVEAMMEMLQMDSHDVRFVGIHGMGGVGKTTLAKVVFNQLHSCFSNAVFLENVRETWKREGAISLHKQMLDNLCSASGDIRDCDSGINKIKKVVHNQKVLIVLDDVDHVEQIQRLAGSSFRYGPGSRIIVTSRNVGVLKQVDDQFQQLEMTELNSVQALQLFSRHAFREKNPPADFINLSRRAALAAAGLPLALEVIGSLLRLKTIEEWEEVIQSLGTNQEIQKILMISYDSLEVRTKQIFLDIACFFINVEKTNCMYMWEPCNFYPNKGLADLISMSLVKISNDNKFQMHDLVRDLGRDIVYQENVMDLGKRSRSWRNEDSLEILHREEGIGNVQALALRTGRYSWDPLILGHEVLRGLRNIRFLALDGVVIGGNLEQHMLPYLRWLSWRNFHLKTVALDLPNLVVLDLTYCDISEVWIRLQMANLKVLTLECCWFASGTLVFPTLNSLERLNLRRCSNLCRLDGSIGKLKRLKYLNAEGCVDLQGLPGEIGCLEDLETILMEGDGKPFSLPESVSNLKSLSVLQLDKVHIKDLPEAFGRLVKLRRFSLRESRVEKLPQSLGNLAALVVLDLSGAIIKEVPDFFGDLKVLKVLKISKTGELPRSVGMAKMLETLDCRNVTSLVEIPTEIGQLSYLKTLTLSLARMPLLPSTISHLSLLQMLHLTDCHNLQELPKLPASLTNLHVTSKSLRKVPDLSEQINLTDLVLSNAANHSYYHSFWQARETSSDRRALHQSWTSMASSSWSLKGQVSSDNLLQTCSLDWIRNLTKLVSLHLNLSITTTPPSQLNHLSRLETLHLACRGWECFPQLPSSLTSLTLGYLLSTSAWPLLSNLRNLSFLGLFSFSMNGDRLESLGIAELECLKTVFISNGKFSELNLQYLPEKLIRLQLRECRSVKRIYNLSLVRLKNLCLLELSVCDELTEIEDLDEAGLSVLSIVGRNALKFKGVPIVGFSLSCKYHERNRCRSPQPQIYLPHLHRIRTEDWYKHLVADREAPK